MGERLLCKQEVIGSIPFTSTNKPRAASARLMDRAKQRFHRRLKASAGSLTSEEWSIRKSVCRRF